MNSPLGSVIFVTTNLVFITVSSLLVGLSFLAYRRNGGQRSYAIATLGFGCIVLGGVTELAFTYWFEPDFVLTSTEFLYLQAGEDILIALGFGLLFYAITKHNAGSSDRTDCASSITEEDLWIAGESSDD